MNSEGTPIESFDVPADQDDGMSSWYHKWCAGCCNPDSCSAAFAEKVLKFRSFADEDAVKGFMINHLFSSWKHKEVTTWAEGEEVVNQFLETCPDTIKQVEETPQQRRQYREQMEQYWAQMQRDDEAKAAAAA